MTPKQRARLTAHFNRCNWIGPKLLLLVVVFSIASALSALWHFLMNAGTYGNFGIYVTLTFVSAWSVAALAYTADRLRDLLREDSP